MKNINIKKRLLPNIPYVFIALLGTKVGQAWRLAVGGDFSAKVLHLLDGFAAAFHSLLPCFHPVDLCVGVAIAAAIRLIVYVKGKNAKKFRKNMEYGTARWGAPEDIKPYKDNADTIIGNCDSSIFLGGKEPTTLKELASALGKETIDTFNTGESRGREVSHSLNYQKLGKELMSIDELAVLDGGKCILQLRGVRPFLSDKYDIVVVQPSGILGPYDNGKNHVVQMVKQYMDGRLPGGVKGGYDFVDVRDVAKGCSIVEKVIRMKFAEIAAASESEILARQHEREIELARIRLDAARALLKEKENDLEDYKAETLKVIRGKSKLSIDLLNTLVADAEGEIKAAQADTVVAEQAHTELCESAEKLRQEYDKLLTWADLFDKSTFEAKKMIVAQFVKAVRVGRDYNIEIDFNVSFEEFQTYSLENGEAEEMLASCSQPA